MHILCSAVRNGHSGLSLVVDFGSNPKRL